MDQEKYKKKYLKYKKKYVEYQRGGGVSADDVMASIVYNSLFMALGFGSAAVASVGIDIADGVLNKDKKDINNIIKNAIKYGGKSAAGVGLMRAVWYKLYAKP